jgi:maltose alpha-D-glucosyltransferase/alpha-amylase
VAGDQSGRDAGSAAQSLRDLALGAGEGGLSVDATVDLVRPGADPIDRSDKLWFKDAIIYQLHLKAFFDSNNDGIGDLAGLMQKLDYLKECGVTAIWLLPFYPSPFRDGGYDIADYRNVHPSYGTMREFRALVRACHERGLRVITELVINHTSDQHPWFQRARRAKPGSNFRNYYVWSDTDQAYRGTRIIFLDTEPSNWSWDPVAKAYYWHRFYSHQPDLNFDNPHVLDEVIRLLHFWLSMGVDGLRLDAIPYLIEREGTNNENLPETHDILKRIRAEMEAKFPDRMLLAEANQWPEDVLPYFGSGDECHMAFHFPLMPRMYMAIAQEDRHPITDIMRQTPDIPANCQWAIFLRNHDELTLEMVTDRERDYLWKHYATDGRMRLNLGIRRRLAPLMGNDRRKIELMTGLLLAMPGTPIMYYGDEIGMGDNVFLGDRDGVRTPMQWSPDRNGGFSRADTAQLFLPPIMDPIYGFSAVNVEAQARSPSSLLNWTKRMLAIRQGQRAFGRGTLEFLYPGNRKILAFLRIHEGRKILCVYNLAQAAQAVELDLARFKDSTPVELMGRSAFPPIGDLPYLLTLPGHAFYWFILAGREELPTWHGPIPEPVPEFVTLVAREGWRDIIRNPALGLLEREALPRFVGLQRWFAAKNDKIAQIKVSHACELKGEGPSYLLTLLDVGLASGGSQGYQLPLGTASDAEASSGGGTQVSFMVAQARRGPKLEGVCDALALREFPMALLRAIAAGRDVEGPDGRLRFQVTDEMRALEIAPDAEVRRIGGEQTNSSVLIGEKVMLKLYRRLAEGVHPEVEVGQFLHRAGYKNAPPTLGAVEYLPAKGGVYALAIAHGFVRNQGDGWTHILDHLQRLFHVREVQPGAGEAAPGDPWDPAHNLALIGTLGRRIGELHQALASDSADPAFAPEPIMPADLKQWRVAANSMADAAFAAIDQAARNGSGELREQAEALAKRKREAKALVDRLASGTVEATKTRIHGDLHLGQVLIAQNDWLVIDFEGEPAASMADRRRKHSPLRDVAGMLRSFDYAAQSALRRAATTVGATPKALLEEALAWRDKAALAFLEAYRGVAAELPGYPRKQADADRLVDLFRLEKAFYEAAYEAAHRPDWLGIPLGGIGAILDQNA